MSDAARARKWRSCKHSIIGASHERSGMPNQDACDVKQLEQAGSVIAAVADGHGSVKSFRSNRGARFAVESAVEELEKLCCEEWRDPRGFDFRQRVEVDLPRQIVDTWQRKVDTDLAADPISSPSDLQSATAGPINSDSRKAYGTTVVAALIMPECAVYLQLGDGDILVVGDNPCAVTRPLPPDSQSFANETASLASNDSTTASKRPGIARGPSADFRVRVIPAEVPELILLTTDGYVNAFVTDADFLRVATDLAQFGRSEGWEFVEHQLPEWLREASHFGSGDDVTVVLLIRDDRDDGEAAANEPETKTTAHQDDAATPNTD